MGRFKGMLICTDLDGTLIKNDKTISNENIKAIEFFKSKGGKFSFITGRMPFFVSDIYNAVNPNAPIGCINGGGVYDCFAQKYIWKKEMPRSVLELIKYVDEKFHDVGIQVNTFYKTYFCKENNAMEDFRKITGLPNLIGNYNFIEEPIAKIVFVTDNEDTILLLEKELKNHPLADNFDFIRAEKTLYEILPKGITKGTALTKLAEYLKIDINKTIVIGDYYNDISMFNAAGISFAVSNACNEALEVADYITVSNEENAIAKVIYDLYYEKY